MMLNGKLTICRHGIIGEDYITLRVEDEKSSSLVLNAKISLDEFMRALTNLSATKCEFQINEEGLNIWGKEKEIKTVFFDNPNRYSNKEKSKESVRKHFEENYGNTEWQIWSDGTLNQQNGNLYKYIICRYINNSEVTND